MTPIKEVKPATGLPPVGPYSPAVVSGNMVFVSGQIPRDDNGKLVADSIEAATKTVPRQLHAVLWRPAARLRAW